MEDFKKLKIKKKCLEINQFLKNDSIKSTKDRSAMYYCMNMPFIQQKNLYIQKIITNLVPV